MIISTIFMPNSSLLVIVVLIVFSILYLLKKWSIDILPSLKGGDS